MNGDVSGIKQSYIAKKGVYLQSDGETVYDYSDRGATVDGDEAVAESAPIDIVNTDEVESISDDGSVLAI